LWDRASLAVEVLTREPRKLDYAVAEVAMTRDGATLALAFASGTVEL